MEIDNEVCILAKPYSVLRRRQNKWKYRGSVVDQYVVRVNQDLYSVRELRMRKEIKRSQRVFCEVFKFWQVVNQFSIPGLSRAVYSKILKFIYKTVFKMHLSEFVFDEYVNNDVKLDFKDESCLFFCDFYDAFFDIIDQVTCGKTVPEYLTTINSLCKELKFSGTLNVVNLNNKAHCAGKKPKYAVWMKEFLKVRVEEKESLRSLPRIQSTQNYLDYTNPLSIKKKSGVIKSFLLEEIIEGRNKFLTAYHEEKKKIKAKDILKKISGKAYV